MVVNCKKQQNQEKYLKLIQLNSSYMIKICESYLTLQSQCHLWSVACLTKAGSTENIRFLCIGWLGDCCMIQQSCLSIRTAVKNLTKDTIYNNLSCGRTVYSPLAVNIAATQVYSTYTPIKRIYIYK